MSVWAGPLLTLYLMGWVVTIAIVDNATQRARAAKGEVASQERWLKYLILMPVALVQFVINLRVAHLGDALFAAGLVLLFVASRWSRAKTRERRPPSHLIDLSLDELVLDPEVLQSAKKRDERTVPSAMAQYIQRTQGIPLGPDVSYHGDNKFIPLDCGVTLSAAVVAGFKGTVRCFYREAPDRLPPALRSRLRTLADMRDEYYAPETSPSWQLLSFSRALTPEEKARVLAGLEELTQVAKEQKSTRFSAILDPDWIAEDTLGFRTWVDPNTEDRRVLPNLTNLFGSLVQEGVPLIAWNGSLVWCVSSTSAMPDAQSPRNTQS